ncbi:hypothetical protein PC122_g17641 [Phytophthora cactorum]|nr:hypothetical protein PC122_g17641 [Phytophthora cactorum]
MRLFLPEGYDATGSDSAAKTRILKAGQDAEEAILAFLKARNEKTKAFGTVVKTLKKIHTKGELNEHILQYRALGAGGRVVDSSHSTTATCTTSTRSRVSTPRHHSQLLRIQHTLIHNVQVNCYLSSVLLAAALVLLLLPPTPPSTHTASLLLVLLATRAITFPGPVHAASLLLVSPPRRRSALGPRSLSELSEVRIYTVWTFSSVPFGKSLE